MDHDTKFQYIFDNNTINTFAVVNGYHYVLEYQRCEHKAIDIAQITWINIIKEEIVLQYFVSYKLIKPIIQINWSPSESHTWYVSNLESAVFKI